MSVDERLMAAGTWSMNLDPATPESIKALSANAYSQVVVTPVRVDSSAIAADDLADLALYTGLIRDRSDDRLQWGGPGLPVLLGDEDGKANTHTASSAVAARPLYNGSATSWVRNNVLRAGAGGANGIRVGAIASSATPAKAGNVEVGDSPRDVLDFVCDLFSGSGGNPYEWNINPDGTLDVARRATLFPKTAAPTTIAVSGTPVRDTPALKVVPMSQLEVVDDWEDWSSTVFVTGPTVTLFGTEYTFSGSDDISSNPYNDLDGVDIVMRRVVTSNKSKSNADNEAIAERKMNRFDSVARRLSMSTDMDDVRSWVKPGDSMYVFDEDADLLSLSVQVDAGETVFPLASRVHGMNWPVTAGMGVYHFRPNYSVGELWPQSTVVVTDLSEYVVFDEPGVRFDMGEPRRLLVRRNPRSLAS